MQTSRISLPFIFLLALSCTGGTLEEEKPSIEQSADTGSCVFELVDFRNPALPISESNTAIIFSCTEHVNRYGAAKACADLKDLGIESAVRMEFDPNNLKSGWTPGGKCPLQAALGFCEEGIEEGVIQKKFLYDDELGDSRVGSKNAARAFREACRVVGGKWTELIKFE